VSKVTQNGGKCQPTLRLYIAQHCPTCRDALRIVDGIQRRLAAVDVQVINLETEGAENIDGVFSVPTYVLDGRTLSLGNPDPEQLLRVLSELSTPKGQ
jgi:predicted thioredoxin/glutaredoxin